MPIQNYSLELLQRAFFTAMQCGWASGNKGIRVAGLIGWSQIRHREGDLLVVDRWGKDPLSGIPSGSTVIMFRSTPLWVMWYGGYGYNPEAISFLRESLMKNYSRNVFNGGRGPAMYENTKYLYANKCEGDFAQFKGQEHILRLHGDDEADHAGAHRYWGGSLLLLK